MNKKEELVDFVVGDGVTVYPGGSIVGHTAGSVARLPKSHAEAFAQQAKPAAAKPAAEPKPAKQA